MMPTENNKGRTNKDGKILGKWLHIPDNSPFLPFTNPILESFSSPCFLTFMFVIFSSLSTSLFAVINPILETLFSEKKYWNESRIWSLLFYFLSKSHNISTFLYSFSANLGSLWLSILPIFPVTPISLRPLFSFQFVPLNLSKCVFLF